MSESLCPCPFCNAQPRIYQTEYRIKCTNQSCPVAPSVMSNDLDVATTRWNTRPADTKLVDTETGEVQHVD